MLGASEKATLKVLSHVTAWKNKCPMQDGKKHSLSKRRKFYYFYYYFCISDVKSSHCSN